MARNRLAHGYQGHLGGGEKGIERLDGNQNMKR